MTERDRIDLTDDLTPTQQEALLRLLANPTVWEEADPALEGTIVAAITAEAAAEGLPAARDDIEVVAAPLARSRPALTRPRRGNGGWGLLLGAAVAATLMVVVVVVAALRRPAEPVRNRFDLFAAAAPVGDGWATAEATPDGVRIRLWVEELPPAPEGGYYELWVHREGGRPDEAVSGGTFHNRGGGDEVIELWTGVPIDEYPLVTVTVEREGDGPGSSGDVVLTGRMP